MWIYKSINPNIRVVSKFKVTGVRNNLDSIIFFSVYKNTVLVHS